MYTLSGIFLAQNIDGPIHLHTKFKIFDGPFRILPKNP